MGYSLACGLSKTNQGLFSGLRPTKENQGLFSGLRSVENKSGIILRPHLREEEYILDGRLIGHQHR